MRAAGYGLGVGFVRSFPPLSFSVLFTLAPASEMKKKEGGRGKDARTACPVEPQVRNPEHG